MSEQIFHVGVKALIQNDDGEVLLMLNRFPDRELWDIPGGRMDEAEEIADTLRRELKEEIGLANCEIGEHFMTVKSNKKVALNAGDAGLLLVVYRVIARDQASLVAKEDNSEIIWKDAKEASLLLRDKYPLEFCEQVGRL